MLPQAPGYLKNSAQRLLAEEVTRFVHGEEGLRQALRATEVGVSTQQQKRLLNVECTLKINHRADCLEDCKVECTLTTIKLAVHLAG